MDSVDRLIKFRENHPDITIEPPTKLSPFWEAYKDGKVIVHAYWLDKLLDTLEAHVQ